MALLQAELCERHISARELARRLGVAPATVTRFLNGAVARSRLRIEAVCDAMGLREGSMRRRELLRLAAAGALALSVGAPVMLRTRGLDLDEVARRMDGLERLRAAGRLQEAWDAAQEPELRGMIRRARTLERDVPARATRFRYDFVVATMREQRAPWTVSAERATQVVAWYEVVQHELLRFSPPSEVSHELAQIHERIAPLYREKGDYNASVWSFDFALQQRAERAEDMALAVHLWRNRAHVWATRYDERRWREDLDAAGRMVERLPADMRDELHGLLTYSAGEGLKRLANRTGLEWRDRQALARQARDTLLRSLTQTRQQWAAHEAVTRLSAAQALVLLDPAAALAELDHLEPLVRAMMPAHVGKLAQARSAAERALIPRRARA